ncbi:MAG: hypothetical protein WCJ30_27555, partial [Deltaproteobacteria bacterium]
MISPFSILACLTSRSRIMLLFLLGSGIANICPAANTGPSSGANAPTTPDPQLQEPLHARGLPVPSRAQQEKIQQLPKIARVTPNALGLQRVSAARRLNGGNTLLDPSVTPAPFGKEIILSPDPAVSSPPLTNTTSSALPQTTAISPSGYADNSALNAFPPIRNQGSQGSCAAFSTTYYQMTHMTALARDWDARNGSDAFHFSPKWTYNMINGGSDSGSFIDENLALMRDHGSARWSDFPYTGSSYDFLAWCMTPSVWSNAISFRMNDFSTVPGLYDDANLTTLKTILDNGYVVTFDTYSPWAYQGWVKGTVGN